MEATEEAMPPPHVVKRRRTKRQRNSPTTMASALSSSSEEEDMANCLILLAQGTAPETAASTGVATDEKAGFFSYRCKTCDKRFASFQALGGHRTSHKKPKLPIAPLPERKTGEIEENSIQLSMNSFSNSNNGKIARVHECAICGSEFSSGQALGGHMRRHRHTCLAEPVEAKKEKNNPVMALDLNLPASDDDYSCSGGDELPRSPLAAAANYSFARTPPLLLSPSALVDYLC